MDNFQDIDMDLDILYVDIDTDTDSDSYTDKHRDREKQEFNEIIPKKLSGTKRAFLNLRKAKISRKCLFSHKSKIFGNILLFQTFSRKC